MADRLSFAALDEQDAFLRRHIGPSDADRAQMLTLLGYDSVEALLDVAVPASIRSPEPLTLAAPRSESVVLRELRALSERNEVVTSCIGMGYHGTITPPVILRNVLEDPAWYTAYTPYQPEISQGRLEALLNFQTMVADLTGMDIANASMLDEGTAAAEAMTLLRRSVKGLPDRFFVDAACHPQTIAVVATRAEPIGIEVVVGDPRTDLVADDVFGVLLQYPDTYGEIHDPRPVIEAVHAAGGQVAVAADPLAMVVLDSPGSLGADAVVGSSQRFGVPMMFGGPHAGFLAVHDAARRTLPGRLVGVSVDAAGRQAYRLALQTREQHIRREKATSNICTAQVLLAVTAAMYAVYHGPDGLERIARRVHRLAATLAAGLRAGGVMVPTTAFFDTITVQVPDADAALAAALAEGVNVRRVDDATIGVAMDEACDEVTVEALWRALGTPGSFADVEPTAPEAIPDELARSGVLLEHEVFHRHRSETELLRYLRRLSDRDIALDRSMIPLGSCTMKLNATTEMLPITWPAFTDIHPFAPAAQAAGYRTLIAELEAWLADITGYDTVSLQPNAGSQGELAGLLAIRGYHRSRGDEGRDVCLIPSSAHGTNAASAVMAGMRVVVVRCDDDGNVDVEDLRSRCEEHGADLAALMVTYPSTHGVFEDAIGEVCALVHEHGGQVYLDGANLNALVGVARPGWFGSDVSHLNLHKTFCIPHGGGGPGVGPVAVREHLAPFLPNHPVVTDAGPATGPGPISAAPWGSAGILAIPWAYIAMMGGRGLTEATGQAILSANYVARRLGEAYPVLYAGEGGLVAHECILDLRGITRDSGVSVDDVAKRLIDYGFHAPTMSFPVSGTLMVEPTESEPLVELERFCTAMLAIRAEIDRVQQGEWPVDDNPLHHAPHTATDVTADDWDHPYPRSLAGYPVPSLHDTKYWPPVSRIDSAYGDKNVVCSCPPIEAYT